MSTLRVPIAMVLAGLLLGACHAGAPFDAAAPPAERLEDAEVQKIAEPGFPVQGNVRLANGAWEGAPFSAGAAERPRLLLMQGLSAEADLDGDGAAERAALLAASSGGSGERVYIALFGARGDQVVNIGTVLVGDRSKPRALAAEGNELVLDVVEIGPGEAACCGTQLGRHRYRLQGGELHEVAHEVQGALSLEQIQGEWTLIGMDGQSLPAGARAPTFALQGTQVSGFAGCNRYGGGIAEAAPGRFAPPPHAFMSTMMACPSPMAELERAYLAALSGATRYTFVSGRLMIEWENGERRGTLLFTR